MQVLKKVMDLRQTQVDSLSQRAGVGEEAFEAVALRRLSPSEEPLHELEANLTEGALREMSNDVAIARWRGYVRSMEALSAQTRRVSATDCCEEGKQVRAPRHCGAAWLVELTEQVWLRSSGRDERAPPHRCGGKRARSCTASP